MHRPPIRAKQTVSIAALVEQAGNLHQQGKLIEAERLYQAVLKLRPDSFDALHLLGVLRGQQGKPQEAITLIARALRQRPHSAEAYSNLGYALTKLGRYDEAIINYDQALQLKPQYGDALNNRGIALAKLERHDEAIGSYEKALAIEPDRADVFNNRGNALTKLGRYEEAVASYDKALALKPAYADALNNRGIALAKLGRHDEAIAEYGNALVVEPHRADVHYNRGISLAKLERYDEAIASYDKALVFKPDHADALNNRGTALHALNRHEEAIASYEKALAIDPDDTEALYNRSTSLGNLHRYVEAIEGYTRTLAISPQHTDALINRGHLFRALNRDEEALASYTKALEISPDAKYLLGYAMHCRAHICDWENRESMEERLAGDVRSGKLVSPPFSFLAASPHLEDQLLCATGYVRDRYPVARPPLWKGKRYEHKKIRLAYLSADFHDHPTAYLMAELFERHDRNKFEVLGISFGPDRGSDTRGRLMAAFDRFVDVRRMSDMQVARLLHESEVDIAIDLKGFTQNCRPRILAHRPAPIQVSYLGYPGTMGAEYIDYVIADEFVIPRHHQIHYSEKVVYLPECYQVNDTKRKIAERTPTRAEVGLPEHGFVFCCFNNNFKLTPRVFDIWMQLLQRVNGSVLWLLQGSATAEKNLRREARARDIDPDRLIFAQRMKLEQHLARHRLADLFLDTLPYNAHTTASDALWTGLPVLTCAGTTFAGRVAGSLLQAVGLPELVIDTLEAYEALALRLATDHSLLQETKEKLARNCLTAPLFDIDRFQRHIEAAYTTMSDVHQRCEEPKAFAVPPM